MNRKIILLILIAILSLNSALANIFVIDLQRTGETISFSETNIAEGNGPNYDPQDYGYKATIYSFKNETLFSQNFSVGEPEIIERPIDPNATYEFGRITPNEELITLTFPYYNNAKKIEILDETGKLKLEIDLSGYARCNENDFCDFNEDMQRCPEDCREEIVVEKPQEQITEEVKEPTQAAIEETVQEKTLIQKLEDGGISQNLLIIIAVLAVILIIILVLSRKKEK